MPEVKTYKEDLHDIYVPKLERAFKKAMQGIHLNYALVSFRDLIMQLWRIWQIVMLMEEVTWLLENSIPTDKLDSISYLVHSLKYRTGSGKEPPLARPPI